MARYSTTELFAAAARTATPTSSAVAHTGTGNSVSIALSATAKTGTSPTLDIAVWWSFDKSLWLNAAADNFTQLTDTGQQFKALAVRAPFMKVISTIGGSASPGYTYSLNVLVLE